MTPAISKAPCVHWSAFLASVRHDLWKIRWSCILPDEPEMMAAVSRMLKGAVSTTVICLPIKEEPCLAGAAADRTVCDVLCPLAVFPHLQHDPPTISAWIIDLMNSGLWSSTELSLGIHSPENLLAENYSWVIFKIQQWLFRYKIYMLTRDSNNILIQIRIKSRLWHSYSNDSRQCIQCYNTKMLFCSIWLGLLKRDILQ